jgi:hypothetical protein
MDVTAELTRLSGLQQLQAIFAGKTGYAGIVKNIMPSVRTNFSCKPFTSSHHGKSHKR